MVSQRFQFKILCGASKQVIEGLEADLAFCHPAIMGVSLIDPTDGIIELKVRDNLSEIEG